MVGLVRSVLLTVCVAAAVAPHAVAQNQQAPPALPWAGQDAALPIPQKVVPAAVTFNPRDLSGVWLRQGPQGALRCPAADDAGGRSTLPPECAARDLAVL